MPTFIRVKDTSTGHEISIPEALFESNRGAFTKVDKPATDSVGTPLLPKYKTSVSEEAAKKITQSGQKADSKKEDN